MEFVLMDIRTLHFDNSLKQVNSKYEIKEKDKKANLYLSTSTKDFGINYISFDSFDNKVKDQSKNNKDKDKLTMKKNIIRNIHLKASLAKEDFKPSKHYDSFENRFLTEINSIKKRPKDTTPLDLYKRTLLEKAFAEADCYERYEDKVKKIKKYSKLPPLQVVKGFDLLSKNIFNAGKGK